MKPLISLLLVLFQFSVYAQVNSGYAKYVFEQNLDSLKEAADTSKSEDVKTVLLKMIEESSKNDTIFFELRFTENESLFTMSNDSLTVEANKLNLYKIEAQQIGAYYYDKNAKELINQKEYNKETYLIQIETETEWELTNEEKIIGKYLCKKALLKQGHIIDGIRTETPVEVWYTSEVPTVFGPIGLSGLPGLIVEFKLNKLSTIKLKELKLSKNVKINKPENGISVTQKEFKDIFTRSKRMF